MLHTLPHCTVLYVNYISITLGRRNSLEIQWLECCLPMQRVWDRSLVWELRSHMPCGPKKNPPKHKQKQYCNKFTEDFKNHPLGKNIKKKKKRNGQNWRLLISLLTVKLEGYPTMMFIFGEAKILRNWEQLGGAPWHCTPNSPPLHRGGLGLPPAITGASSPRWPIPSALAHPFRAGCGFHLPAPALWTQKTFCLVSHPSIPSPLLFCFPLCQFLFTILWIKLLHGFLCSCGLGSPAWRWNIGPLDLSFLSELLTEAKRGKSWSQGWVRKAGWTEISPEYRSILECSWRLNAV